MIYTLTISLVLYKTKKTELQNIFNCIQNSNIRFKLLLIDNSPTNELKGVLKGSNIIYTHNSKNLGYGKAHNLAIKKIINESKYHLVANTDIIFGKNVLAILIKYLEDHQEAGLVTPQIFDDEGKLQLYCKLLPKPFDLFVRIFTPKWAFRKTKSKFQLENSGYNEVMNIPFLSGCFMLIKTSALKKSGLFDERFFLYGEDIDLTRRIYKNYETIFLPTARIIHKHRKASYKTPKMLAIHIINIIRYFNKWGWFNDNERHKVNRKVLESINKKI